MKKTFKSAKTLCEISDWSLTNLKLQKILYIANRVCIGRHNLQIVDSSFEAWDYGPVSPEIYNECKMYGSKPVKDGFLLVSPHNEGDIEYDILSEAYNALKNKTGGQLVTMTHSNRGAWAKVYHPRAGNIISKELIKEEYRALQK